MGVSIQTIEQTAKKIEKTLLAMPVMLLKPMLEKMGVRVLDGIQNVAVGYVMLRKNGLTRPYRYGDTGDAGEFMSIREHKLEVHTGYVKVSDDLNKYKKAAIPADMVGTNQTHKHPLEVEILTNLVKTLSEDLAYACWYGEHNELGNTTKDLFNGWFYHIAQGVIAGEISVAKNNLFNTGAINMPTSQSDYTAYEQIQEMWESAPEKLKDQETVMLMNRRTRTIYDKARTNYFRNIGSVEKSKYLDDTENMCEIRTVSQMGTGNKIILTAKGNFDFGMNSEGDNSKVEILPIKDDPNEVRFWMQIDAGTRVRVFHPFMFRTNELTNTGSNVGDYE